MNKVLDSFGGLAEMLVADNVRLVVNLETAMGFAAKVVQKDAQDRIGEYQAETGPFPAWEPLADSTEADKARKGFPLDAPLLRTGDMRDTIVTEHNALEAIIGSKDPVAKYQEFGTEHIPPRPFLGPAAYDSRDKVHRIIGKTAAASIGGQPSIEAFYEMEKSALTKT
ncbi:HK97-gp10 family putative phage morphogenesis protein [Sideroxydans lithotrophicus]|uniref:Phage protein, HK97 gp10 family n=1 Tax=Sideroxydans lithotrophicus (strain ES-1) TaxID=580332 RepID=D5CT47_SIDLE|nr:HK97-gp10 family putative phage morphogenesis protein [Sideroxydans lithotrophicus]ADE12133.1 phage protein, HK97 gp10 family [Sideroxydans lithotrophicus ES-1]